MYFHVLTGEGRAKGREGDLGNSEDMFFEVRTQSTVKKNFQSITVLLFWYSEQNNKVTNLGFQNEDEKVPSTTP